LNIVKRRLARLPTASPEHKRGELNESKFFGKKEMFRQKEQIILHFVQDELFLALLGTI